MRLKKTSGGHLVQPSCLSRLPRTRYDVQIWYRCMYSMVQIPMSRYEYLQTQETPQPLWVTCASTHIPIVKKCFLIFRGWKNPLFHVMPIASCLEKSLTPSSLHPFIGYLYRLMRSIWTFPSPRKNGPSSLRLPSWEMPQSFNCLCGPLLVCLQ